MSKYWNTCHKTGCHFNIKMGYPGKGNFIIKMIWLSDHLIFIMGNPILVRWQLYIEMGPSCVKPFPPRLPFNRWYFYIHFHEWNVLYFDSNFTEVCSLGSNWQQPSIGLDHGLALNRRQAIIWTNADPIHWSIYASIGGDEYMVPQRTTDQLWATQWPGPSQ